MKTNWQDPGSVEITSPMISGLQEAVGKIEDSIGLKATAEVDMPLTEVYIQPLDRCRIYQVAEGKRNWVASPAPVIKKNGAVISTGFTIDYGGGAIMLEPRALSTDLFTADFTRTNSTNSITPAAIGAETPTGAQTKVDSAVNALAGTGNTTTVKALDDALSTHQAEYAVLKAKFERTNSFNYADFHDTAILAGTYSIYSTTILNPPFAGTVSGAIDVRRVGNTVYIEFRPWDRSNIYIKSYTAGTWRDWVTLIDTYTIKEGTGSPEGVIYAAQGALYRRLDGGAGTCLYVKETGWSNVGWVAK